MIVRLHPRPFGKLETVTAATRAGGRLYHACAPIAALEIEIAQSLRRLSPAASPNPQLIALADTLLSRQGRMVAAIESIGRGDDCFEGEILRMDPV